MANFSEREQTCERQRSEQAEFADQAGVDTVQPLLNSVDEQYDSNVFTADKALEYVGTWGLYQKRLTCICGLAVGFDALVLYLPVFIAFTPSVVCTSTLATGEAACTCPGGQIQYSPSYTHESLVAQYDLLCEDSWVTNIINSMFFAGWALGVCITGALLDSLGRKACFYISTIGLLCTTLMWVLPLGMSAHWAPVCGVRFLTGMFAGPRNMPAFLMATELLGSAKQRGWVTGLIWTLWGLAATSLAPLAFALHILYRTQLQGDAQGALAGVLAGFPQWRLLCLLGGALEVFPLLLPSSWIADSPRYLLASGREEQARNVLEAIAAANKKPLPANYSFATLAPLQTDLSTDSMASSQSNVGYSRLLSSNIFLGRPMWKITAIISAAYFANSFVFYGLTLSSGTFTNNHYWSYFISTAMQIPPYILNGAIMDFLGRRPTMVWTMLVGGGSCLGFLFIPTDSTFGSVSAFAAVLAITVSFSAIYPYTVELFPTRHRGSAFAVCQFSARVSSVLAPLVPILGKVHKYIPLLIYSAVAIISACSILLLPETKGSVLVDT